MSKKIKSGTITVQVDGIRYEEFAKVKWQQFLRFFSVAVMLLVAVILVGVMTKRITSEIPLSGAAVLLLVVFTVFAVYRSGIRSEYKRAGLASLSLSYSFDRDGWTVKQGNSKATVLWIKTVRVRRNPNALLLYPNKKSVNIVPLRCLKSGELDQIIGYCTGKKN